MMGRDYDDQAKGYNNRNKLLGPITLRQELDLLKS